MQKNVVIVSMSRTPIGSMMGGLKNFSATDLCSIAIKNALHNISLDTNLIEEVFIGNVISAGLGQAPAKQASIKAGIPDTVPCTTINKVCASGMKSIIIAAQSIQCGTIDIAVAGGMESMSNIPHYSHIRSGKKLGNDILTDGLLLDGLINVYDEKHMGTCGDLCALENGISREEQDRYTITSYQKAKNAWDNNLFANEVVPIQFSNKKGETIIIDQDEEYQKVFFDKIPQLKPIFSKDGSVTAANASTLNDGAAAVVLMSEEKAKELDLQPLAKIKSYADASQNPERFTTSPSKAIPNALKKINLSLSDIDFFEINEAFSCVPLANSKLLGIESSKVNINGGAVSLGHPLGMSGTRIVMALISILKQQNGKIGAASICNGGGGASAIIIENM